jgi:hypothetical protein
MVAISVATVNGVTTILGLLNTEYHGFALVSQSQQSYRSMVGGDC